MTLQCLRLTDHTTFNFNNKMSTTAVFLDINKAFDTIGHPGLLYGYGYVSHRTHKKDQQRLCWQGPAANC
jgi:hypothetical protein